MSFYVSGTALGGFLGRVGTGILTDGSTGASLSRARRRFAGRSSCRGRMAAARASDRAPCLASGTTGLPRFPYQVQELFRSRRLVATFAVGFNVLFSLVGVFTWITFHLSAAPFLALDGSPQLALLRLSGRPGGHARRRVPHHPRRPARRHRRQPSSAPWPASCSPSLPRLPSSSSASRCFPPASSSPRPPRRATFAWPRRRRARHRRRPLYDLLLPGRHRGRNSSPAPSGAWANGRPASRSSSPCRRLR